MPNVRTFLREAEESNMSAVFPRTGWFLCSEHPEVMVFYKSNRCPMCVELEERKELDEAIAKLEQFSGLEKFQPERPDDSVYRAMNQLTEDVLNEQTNVPH